jgi:hypothetical protein
MTATRTLGLVLFLAATLTPAATLAQYFDDTIPSEVRSFESPERFVLEFRGGPYRPDVGTSADSVFDGDMGPLLAFEIDVMIFQLKDIGSLLFGTGFGWAAFSGSALDMSGNPAGEETTLIMYPIPLMGAIRIEALSRYLNVPLLFAGKLGLDMIVWDASTGATTDATNLSIGLRWGAQVALELDWFERRAARALDDEWGINHTFILFEIFGSTAASTLPLGPKDGWAWALGLGMVI